MRAQAFTSPLEASIYVEGLRARPAFFVGLLLIVHALIWTLVAWLSDPTFDPKLAIGLALGREWQLGYESTPPLAPWLLELAYRAGGVVAVYALGPAAVALTGWLIFSVARRIAGDRHGALAVFLLVGVHPVAFPVGAFDSSIVQMPLVAFAVQAWWHATVKRNRAAWIVFGVVAGLLFYAGVQGLFVVLTLLVINAVTPTGRAALSTNREQIFAVTGLFLFTLLLTPRMIWLQDHGFAGLLQDLPVPAGDIAKADSIATASAIVLGHIGLLVLVALASRYFARDAEIAPVFMRPPMEAFGKRLAIVLSLVPPLLAAAAAFYVGGSYASIAAAPLLLFSGLLVVVLAGEALRVHRQRMVAVAGLTLLFLPPALELAIASAAPYFGAAGRASNWPAREAARYVTEIYRTRTERPLAFVAASEWMASAVAIESRDRPRIFIDADPARSPWTSREAFETAGGIVIWPIRGSNTEPPAELSERLPALVPESPITLRWTRPGNLDFVRLGWAIVPPRQ